MKLKFGTWSLTPYFIALALIGLQACGGGGGGTPPPPPAANPVGYYAGTASTTSPSQTDIEVKAISDSDKFLMVHIEHTTPNTLLYVGTFTDITDTTFTADVRIYRNGVFLRTATISNGSITERSSMSGTLSGTGEYTATSFSLTYDTVVNSRVTTNIVRGDTDIWLVPTATDTGFRFSNSATRATFVIQSGFSYAHTSLTGCSAPSIDLTNVSGEQEDRIQKYIANYTSGSSCDNYTTDFSMTGYITPYDNGGEDNRYLWITYNDNNFFASDELAL